MTDTVEFLRRLLPSEGYKCWVEINRRKKVTQGFVATHEELAQKLQEIDARGSDAYFACATYKTTDNRRQVNALAAQALWLDLDTRETKANAPYNTVEDAIQACDDFCNRLGLPLPAVVRSGGGVHCYWLFTSPLDADTWTCVATRFKLLTQSHGLYADPARTADMASILRPPGTRNFKNVIAPRMVEVAGDDGFQPLEPVAFIQHLMQIPMPAAQPMHAAGVVSNAALLGGTSKAFDPTKGVAAGCRGSTQLKYAGELVAKGYPEEEVLRLCCEWNQLCTPPQDDKEVLRIVQSVFNMHARKHPPAVTALSEWPEPIPLTAKLEAKPYPLDALPDTIRAAVKEVHGFIQCPIAMVASSALAVVSLAAQSLIDVKRADKLTGPASLFFLTVADSGERKSTCDSFFMYAIRDHERINAEQAKPARKEYQAKLKVWESKIKGLSEAIKRLARSGKDTTEMDKALMALEMQKPEPPRVQRLIYSDVTPESLTWNLAKNWPSGGIISSEGGIVFGAHGMNKETIMRNLATYNILWEGGTYHSDRKSVESYSLSGARLTMALQVQGATLQNFFDNSKGQARGSGFLARFLVSCPESTQGTRTFKEPPSAWPCLATFHKRIEAILKMPVPITPDGALSPVLVSLTLEAKAHWVKFHDEIESKLSAGGQFHEVRDVASKITDNAARLAALFQVFETGASAISLQNMKAAWEIVAWHLYEAQRFFGEIALPVDMINARRLESWLLSYCGQHQTNIIPLRHIRQYGPVRDAKALDAALQELTELGRVRAVQDGRRKDVQVNPALLVAT